MDLHHALGHDLQWWALEDRFTLYGGGIAFIGMPGEAPAPQPLDPAAPVYGPFSADFRWVTLTDWPHGPIRLTEAQAAVFKALWSFSGEPRTAEQVMRRAGLDSAKPIDVFKIKARDRGKVEAEGALFAYRALVVTQQRAGLYAMPSSRSAVGALAQ